MSSFNNNHPELRDGEVFLANMTVDLFEKLPYKSKRIGEKAHGANGEDVNMPLSKDISIDAGDDWGVFPVFISDTEIQKEKVR